jgi:hypothetical protein
MSQRDLTKLLLNQDSDNKLVTLDRVTFDSFSSPSKQERAMTWKPDWLWKEDGYFADIQIADLQKL